jgi:hypothetical protein
MKGAWHFPYIIAKKQHSKKVLIIELACFIHLPFSFEVKVFASGK